MTKDPEVDEVIIAGKLAIKTLNRSFIVTQFIKESLDDLHAEVTQRKKKRLRVKIPSPNGALKELFQTKDTIASILAESLDSTIYQQAFIASVSTVEDSLTSCLRYSLKQHPQKLNLAIDGEKLDKTVSIDSVIKADSITALLDQLISHRILKIMYDRPLNYFKHLKAIAGFEIEDDLQRQFIEIKASRDVYVHNQSISNSVYLEKAGSKARAQVGGRLPIDEKYFSDSIGSMKKLVIEIIKQRRNEL